MFISKTFSQICTERLVVPFRSAHHFILKLESMFSRMVSKLFKYWRIKFGIYSYQLTEYYEGNKFHNYVFVLKHIIRKNRERRVIRCSFRYLKWSSLRLAFNIMGSLECLAAGIWSDDLIFVCTNISKGEKLCFLLGTSWYTRITSGSQVFFLFWNFIHCRTRNFFRPVFSDYYRLTYAGLESLRKVLIQFCLSLFFPL